VKRRTFLAVGGCAIAGTALHGLKFGRAHAAADTSATADKSEPASGPLRRHPENPRYFSDQRGQVVYLTGSHTWNNVVDMGPGDPPPRFDFAAYLDFLCRYGHNFTRLWAWELTSWDTTANRQKARHTVRPHPFARTGPGNALDGKPKFDLERFDPEYFQRLRDRCQAAQRHGLYVSVMLFEGWGLQFVPDAFNFHPFHPQNNVNGINGDVNGDGSGVEVHALASPAVTAIQERYVRKVIDTLNDLDNVLYEISNENHPPSTKWQYHFIDLIHKLERGKAKQHPVGMTFQYKGGSNRTLFDSPADWISPNPEGGYRDDPPAADGKKVILNDTDHLWGIGGNSTWVWKSFLRGINPIFMDPYDGTVLGPQDDKRWDPIRRAMGVTLRLARQLDLARITPQTHLASSGYCLAAVPAASGNKAAACLVVFLPGGGEVEVDLSAVEGNLSVVWIDPVTGTQREGGAVAGGAKRKLASGAKSDSVLWLWSS